MERAGAQMMLLKIVPELSQHGFTPVVISLAAFGPLSKEFSRLGVSTHHIGVRPGRISFRALARLVSILKAERPDLIQGWMYHGNLAAQVAACFIRGCPPLAWSIRQANTDLTREKGLTAMTIRMGAKFSARPVAIIYNSVVSAEEHGRKLKYSRQREVVIPNGFDTVEFAPSSSVWTRIRAELEVPEDAVLVGLVARFHPLKDHATFVEAIARVRSRHPEVRGVLVGEGTDLANASLEVLRARTGTRESIQCLGERTNVPELTAALDIACNSSISEGFPNAVGEAMACGVPCVVTNVGDSGRLVGDTGRVVPAASPESLAAALSELVEMGPKGRRILGDRARRRIVEMFSLDAAVKRYVQTYEAILSRGLS